MKNNNHGVQGRLIGVALLVLASALPARADYQSTVLSQGPVGYWRLNETTQPTPNFTTNLGTLGPSANGFYNDKPEHPLPGPFAGSLAVGFDGLSQYVSNPWLAGLNTTNFTVELWVNPASDSYFAYLASSVDFSSDPARSGWYLAQDDGSTFTFGSAFVFRTFYGNGSAGSATVAAPVTAAGVWTHLIITADGSMLTMYTNGVAATSATISPAYLPNIAAAFTVGARSTFNLFWPGQVAETALYGSALSETRVAAHYAAATGAPASYVATVQADAPVLYHRYREPTEIEVDDPNIGTFGSTADGQYQFGTTPGQVGLRPATYPGFESANYSVGIDGSGAAVSVPALNLDTNTVTISGWVNAANAQKAAAGIIVCDAGTTYAGLTIDVPFGGLGLGYVWNNDKASYNWSPTMDSGLPPLPDSSWAYVALVVQPTQAAIYIALTNDAASFTSATNFLAHGNQKFDGTTLFGSDAGLADYSFNGAIDEVAIFNRALGAGELYSQYASAIGGVPPKIFADPQAPTDPLFVGDSFRLEVDAGGTPNLAYQWYKSSGPIQGATNSYYSQTDVQTADSDNYYVVITNLFDTITSASAVITVNAAFTPAITTPPSGHNLYPGGTLNLSVVATGGGLKYQWKKDGTDIVGATVATYQIPNVTTNDAGNYVVVVSNNVSSVIGGPATVNVFTPSNGYESAIVADAPEAWFRLNETSGTNMFDSMGRHDGVYTNVSGGPVALGAEGAVVGSSDTAVTLNGASDNSYGIVPFSPKLNGTTFSIEAWVKTSDTVTERMAVSSRSGVPQGYGIWSVPAGNLSGQVNDGGTDYYIPSDTASGGIVAGEWKHIVMVYDTSLKVYVNGQWDDNSYVDFERNAAGPFIIGAVGGAAISGVSPWDGQIDEVLVYTNALTLTQAQNHYSLARFPNPIAPYFLVVPSSDQVVSNAAATVTLRGSADGPVPITYQWYQNEVMVAGATSPSIVLSCVYSNAGSYVLRATNPNGSTNSPAASLAVIPPNPPFVNVTNALVLHLKFEGDYLDSSGRGNNGTAVGSPSIVPGRFGSGAFLSTSNSIPEVNYVTLGKPVDLNFSSNVNFSVAYWVKYAAGQTNGDLPYLCSAIGSYSAPGFTFAPSYNQGGWSYSLNGGVLTYGEVNTINDGNWHHLVHTFDRTGNALTYLDGGLVDSRFANGAGNLDTGNIINVGQDPTGAYPEDGSVTIDDLAVWRRALTSYEAYATHYAATNSNTSFDVPGTVALKIGVSGANVVLSWQPGATLGTLLQADDLTGPWNSVGAYTPVFQVPASATRKFYRLSFDE